MKFVAMKFWLLIVGILTAREEQSTNISHFSLVRLRGVNLRVCAKYYRALLVSISFVQLYCHLSTIVTV